MRFCAQIARCSRCRWLAPINDEPTTHTLKSEWLEFLAVLNFNQQSRTHFNSTARAVCIRSELLAGFTRWSLKSQPSQKPVNRRWFQQRFYNWINLNCVWCDVMKLKDVIYTNDIMLSILWIRARVCISGYLARLPVSLFRNCWAKTALELL